MMIIDAHVHLDNVTHSKLSAERRVQRLLGDMKKNKIDHALVLADVPSPGFKHVQHEYLSHEETLKLIGQHKQLHLVGRVPLQMCQKSEYLKHLRAHIAAKRIIGIKLYPGYEPFYAHDKRYNKVYDMCEDFEIPVMIHTGDVMEGGYLKYATPLHIDELAANRPKLNIIMCHMGNPWELDAAAVTFKNANVYADTAGLFYKRLSKDAKSFLHGKLEEFVHWNEKGEKLVFGSDWPITDTKDTISLINSLRFSDKEKHMIFCKNAKKLFDIK